jgi:hypothetical protein
MDYINNFPDLLFYMNHAFRAPVFTDLQSMIKYLAIMYGVTPREMSEIIQDGKFELSMGFIR